MLRLIGFVSFVFLPFGLFGQTDLARRLSSMDHFSMIRKSDVPFKTVGICHLGDSIVLDTTRVTVRYEVTAVPDSAKDYRMYDCALLQIGSRYSKFYGLTTWRYDMNLTRRDMGKEQVAYDDIRDHVVDYEVMIDIPSRAMIVSHHVMFTQDVLFAYEEPVPDLNWQITGEDRMIHGYRCFRACVRYNGRDWTVWFTPDIPVGCGPWKLGGLPGLIMEAQDAKGHYGFSVSAVENRSVPIVNYNIRTKWMTRRSWLDFERQAHMHPVETFGNGGQVVFLSVDTETDQTILLDDTWTIPYNPLELE